MGRDRSGYNDPSIRMLRSSLGKQVYSTKPTVPAYGFGSSMRDQFLKQYLSPEHARTMSGNNSQGPVYRVYSSMGDQINSQLQSSEKYGFGTAKRTAMSARSAVPGPGAYRHEHSCGLMKDSRRASSARPVFGNETRDGRNKQFMDEELEKTFYGKYSPGPATYKHAMALGKQTLSTKTSMPGWAIGSAERFKYDHVERAKVLPGAGQYKQYVSMGRMPVSQKKSLPAYSFGTSQRDKILHKQYLSAEHEKQNHGHNSPGPTTASQRSSMYRQPLSTKRSAPGWGFGTSARASGGYADSPGPGAYFA